MIYHIENFVYRTLRVHEIEQGRALQQDLKDKIKRMSKDVDKLNPKELNQNWKKTWKRIYDKWGETDICCALSEYNIDAKLNCAFIAIGLLYGEGDFERSMEISARCGADSDCNPSNCAGVMGIILGYDKIPSEWTKYIDEIADSLFIYTDYSFTKAVDRTLYYAKKLVFQNGGKVEDNFLFIKKQEPVPAKLEVSFPNIFPKCISNIQLSLCVCNQIQFN